MLTELQPVCILRNHGLLSWGLTVASAFHYLWVLQRACEIQVAGAALGPSIPISKEIQQRCQNDVAAVNKNPDLGREMFEAMKRLVTHDDPSWAT